MERWLQRKLVAALDTRSVTITVMHLMHLFHSSARWRERLGSTKVCIYRDYPTLWVWSGRSGGGAQVGTRSGKEKGGEIELWSEAIVLGTTRPKERPELAGLGGWLL